MADPFYGTVDAFQAYWVDRGQQAAIIAFDDPEISAALLVASGWLDAAFRSSFAGIKVGGRDQIRDWPRNGVQDIYGYYVPNDSIPREVQNATFEAALRQLQTPGVFFKDYTASKYKSVSISGAISVDFAIGSAYDFQTQMPAVAAILAPVLTAMGGGSFSSLSGGVGRV